MFRIDHNHSIYITQGDTAEIDIRVFNKDWHIREEPEFHRGPELMPLLPLWDSEGFIFDSEGYPIYPVDSEGRPYFPIDFDSEGEPIITPIPCDSEGKPYIEIDKVFKFRPMRLPRMKWPKWSQIEEPIRKRDQLILKVKDLLSGEIVLEKVNDEFKNAILLYQEDTKELDPKVYMYQLTYIPYYPDMEEEDMEVNTMITGLFEVGDKF